MALQKRDWIFVAIMVAVFGTFFLISGQEKTTRVPFDEIHQKYYPVIRNEGKKAGEKFCKECHTEEKLPFPAGHPPKFRCLFCHKLEEH